MMKRLLVLIFLLVGAGPLAGQDTTAVRATPPDTTSNRFSPGKAMMRSMILPGWGQFSVGAVKRGALFAALQGSSYYMLVRTNSRLHKAEEKLDTRVGVVRDSLIDAATAPEDTAGLQARLDTTVLVNAERSLVTSRKRHMQDWITYTIFFTLASGVDAFVAAHLADFPAQIGTEPQLDGSVNLRLSVPLPSKRQR
jgi:hypothetical protein